MTDAIVQHALDLGKSVFNAMTVAENPDMAFPDAEPPADSVLYGRVAAAETAYYEYLIEQRGRLGSEPEFRDSYEFLDWLTSENADLLDYQTWTHDPEEPLRREDRRAREELPVLIEHDGQGQPEPPAPDAMGRFPWTAIPDDPPF